jgi:hypothetical protein
MAYRPPLAVLRDDLQSIAPCQDICDDLATTLTKRSIYIDDHRGYQAASAGRTCAVMSHHIMSQTCGVSDWKESAIILHIQQLALPVFFSSHHPLISLSSEVFLFISQ